MPCADSKSEKWFEAIEQDNVQFLQTHMKLARARDGAKELRSFTGLMHAARANARQCFAFLLPLEYDMLTLYTLEVGGVTLKSLSSIAHVLIAYRNEDLLAYLLAQIKINEKYQVLLGKQNSLGITASHLSLMVGDSVWCTNEMVFQKEFVQVTEDRMTNAMLCCFFGRVYYAKRLLQMFRTATRQGDNVEVLRICNLLQAKDENGRNCQDAAEDEFEGADYEGKDQCLQVFLQILQNSEEVLQDNTFEDEQQNTQDDTTTVQSCDGQEMKNHVLWDAMQV